MLMRKYDVKITQRLALLQLPPRAAAPPYRHDVRTMLARPGGDAEAATIPESSLPVEAASEYVAAATRTTASTATATIASAGTESDAAAGSSALSPASIQAEDVRAFVEEALDRLLRGLQDTDVIVRWSAAKGIARITARLPDTMADDIVGPILPLLDDTSAGGFAAHGACFALAELVRRGALPPQRLADVVGGLCHGRCGHSPGLISAGGRPTQIPGVLRALTFEVRRGASAVGGYVRDAACYVCWSLARAMSPEHVRYAALRSSMRAIAPPSRAPYPPPWPLDAIIISSASRVVAGAAIVIVATSIRRCRGGGNTSGVAIWAAEHCGAGRTRWT